MSASNTALPGIRAATATDTEPSGEIPVPFSINTRTNATICRATKKKIAGGSSAKNSSLSFVDSLVMELNYDESYLFHGCVGHHSVKHNGGPQRDADRTRPDTGSAKDDNCAKVIYHHRADQSSRGATLRVVLREPIRNAKGEQRGSGHTSKRHRGGRIERRTEQECDRRRWKTQQRQADPQPN